MKRANLNPVLIFLCFFILLGTLAQPAVASSDGDTLTFKVSDYIVIPGKNNPVITSKYHIFEMGDPVDARGKPLNAKEIIAVDTTDLLTGTADPDNRVLYFAGEGAIQHPKYRLVSGQQVLIRYAAYREFTITDKDTSGANLNFELHPVYSSYGYAGSDAANGWFYTSYFQRLQWYRVEFRGGPNQDIELTMQLTLDKMNGYIGGWDSATNGPFDPQTTVVNYSYTHILGLKGSKLGNHDTVTTGARPNRWFNMRNLYRLLDKYPGNGAVQDSENKFGSPTPPGNTLPYSFLNFFIIPGRRLTTLPDDPHGFPPMKELMLGGYNTYELTASDVPGYTKTLTRVKVDRFDIVYTRIPLIATKTWVGLTREQAQAVIDKDSEALDVKLQLYRQVVGGQPEAVDVPELTLAFPHTNGVVGEPNAGSHYSASFSGWEQDKANYPANDPDGKPYAYFVREVAANAEPLAEIVTLIDSTEDGLSATNTYEYTAPAPEPEPEPEPEPQYATIKVPISAKKLLKHGTLSESQFTFVLKGPTGKVLAEVGNLANGMVLFPDRTFSRAVNNYEYTLTEKAGGDDKVSYDGSVYTLKVSTVPLDGKLVATTTVLKDGKPHSGDITFTNVRMLPRTGDSALNTVLLLGFAALVLGAGTLLIHRRKAKAP